MLDILYQDDYLIAINKPCGLLVHRTSIAESDGPFVLQLLRDQVGCKLFPVHRIDRPTSGVLVFAFSPEVARQLNDQLTNGVSHKKYVALVRGWFSQEIICNRPVKNDRDNLQEALTRFVPLKQLELPLATDRYPTARFSVVEAYPLTGRWHQIRQHLAQLRHYIINDRVHGRAFLIRRLCITRLTGSVRYMSVPTIRHLVFCTNPHFGSTIKKNNPITSAWYWASLKPSNWTSGAS